ncbi:MAG: hypothetical protein R3E01_26750 [Pirellulaceae bacterium]
MIDHTSQVTIPWRLVEDCRGARQLDLLIRFKEESLRRRMRRTPWVFSLWPGLPQLWFEGDLTGLAVAVVFAIFLQVALAASFLWPAWMGSAARSGVWISVIGLWLSVSGRRLAQRIWSTETPAELDGMALFIDAQDQYLRGNWYQAELALQRLLNDNPTDIEAQLLLSTLYRRVGRREDCWECLQALATFPGATYWRWEIDQEAQRLEQWDQERDQQDNSERSGGPMSDAA